MPVQATLSCNHPNIAQTGNIAPIGNVTFGIQIRCQTFDIISPLAPSPIPLFVSGQYCLIVLILLLMCFQTPRVRLASRQAAGTMGTRTTTVFAHS